MISYINGEIWKINNGSILIETGGIGYLVFISSESSNSLKIGQTVRIFTYMNVKEDGITLYGFLDEEEQRIFNKLITVSGVGPKNAMTILSSIKPSDIILAIVSEDINMLSKAQGIGKKTAQRITLELKDKFKDEDILPANMSPSKSFLKATVAVNESIEALVALGYSQSEATRAVMSVAIEGMEVDHIIKLSLKKISS